jgi:multidrug efflux system outer membrane protein
VWKRISSLKRGAVLDMEATREDLESIAMTLAAQVAEAWFSLVEQEAQTRLLDRQQKTGRIFLELTRLRFSQGLASALDVYQQRQQLAATRAEVPLVESRKEVFLHQLAVLVGDPPRGLVTPERETLPPLPPLPPTGLPSDLLTQRPDVRSAHLRLAAADYRVAAAVAARLPALRIGAETGYETRDFNEIENIFDNWIWSLFANITWPVFDGGRRKAEVDRNKAVVKEALGAYGQVILRALKEVEDALIQERKQAEFLLELERQVQLARDTLREARMRYANGLSDYLPVLAALESLQTVERSQIVAERQLLSFRVQLYRALGGTWTLALEPPEEPSEKRG